METLSSTNYYHVHRIPTWVSTLDADKERQKICKFQVKQIHTFLKEKKKKSLHIIWSNQSASVMFLYVSGNPF